MYDARTELRERSEDVWLSISAVYKTIIPRTYVSVWGASYGQVRLRSTRSRGAEVYMELQSVGTWVKIKKEKVLWNRCALMNDLIHRCTLSKFKIQNKFNKLLFQKFVQPIPTSVKQFDEEGLAELAESPVKMESSNQSSFVSRKLKAMSFVAGSRLRASKLAEKQIPAIVRDYSWRNDDSMVENHIGKRWHTALIDGFLEIAQEEVVNRVGKSRSYVANFCCLLTLPVPVQEPCLKVASYQSMHVLYLD